MKALNKIILCLILLIPACCISMLSFPLSAAEADEALSELPEHHKIPAVYLTIDPAEFDKVNESEDHSYRARTGSMMIRVPDGYTGDYSPEELEDTQELELEYIRGRGHGTWSADKKPYRIKLKEKADLLGMGTNQHWVLLANRYDPSLLRNRLISYIGTEFGLAFTPKCLSVDLVVNGEYYGSYLLSEQVRIGKNRVEIDELTEEDISDPERTGGYLLFMNPLWDEPLENVYITDRMVRFGCDSPQFTEGEAEQKEQKAYITGYIQNTEDAVFGQDFCDEDGTAYSDYMDITAAARYWWIQEYSNNYDGMKTTSTYLYKERGGKLYWGPLWDFDLALGGGNDNIDGFCNCPLFLSKNPLKLAFKVLYGIIQIEHWRSKIMSKKKETYDSICRKINSLLERQEQEKQRMMRVMADVLLTDRVASKIGDFSDTELKKTMRLLSGYMENCIAQVIAERKPPGTQAEVPGRNFQ